MLFEGRTLAPGASAGVETTAFKQILCYRGTFGLDTPSALDQRIAFETKTEELYFIASSSIS